MISRPIKGVYKAFEGPCTCLRKFCKALTLSSRPQTKSRLCKAAGPYMAIPKTIYDSLLGLVGDNNPRIY